jgi:hypothetical protein
MLLLVLLCLLLVLLCLLLLAASLCLSAAAVYACASRDTCLAIQLGGGPRALQQQQCSSNSTAESTDSLLQKLLQHATFWPVR